MLYWDMAAIDSNLYNLVLTSNMYNLDNINDMSQSSMTC